MGEQNNDQHQSDSDKRTAKKLPANRPEPKPWALAGAGIELAAAVAALALIGWWLDESMDTSPWLTVTGALLGVTGGLYNLFKHVRRYL